MKQINLSIQGVELDFLSARKLAGSIAAQIDSEPTVVAWHDAPHARMAPVIEGADIHTRWRDYGESHGGNVTISINGEYDFIFAEGAEFASLGSSPYINVRDSLGNDYLCLPEALRNATNPTEEACFPLENDASYSHLHAG